MHFMNLAGRAGHLHTGERKHYGERVLTPTVACTGKIKQGPGWIPEARQRSQEEDERLLIITEKLLCWSIPVCRTDWFLSLLE